MKSNQHRPAQRLCPLALAMGLAFGSAGASAQMIFSAPWYGNADMTPYSENHVEFGLGYYGSQTTGLAAGLGEWTGLNDTGYRVLGNVVAGKQDDATGNYWGLSGFNLGLSSAMVNAEAGKQGAWWLRGNYQGITKAAAKGAIVEYTTGAAQTAVPFYATDVEVRRSTYGLSGGFGLLGNWQTFADYSLTQRAGNQLIGSYAAYHKSLAPVDDETQRMKIGANYTADAWQAEVAYTFSRYSNSVGNSYTVSSSSSGAIGLAPDNDWNQVAAKAGYTFDRQTRLTGSIGHSWTSQNETFANADLSSVAVIGPDGKKVTSLNGEVKQTVADLALVTRVANAVGLRANYHFVDRNSDTPSYAYSYTNHKGNTFTPSWTTNRFKVDADYSPMRRTKLRAWYQYEKKDYKNSEQSIRDDLNTNQFGAELAARGNSYVTGLLRYQYDKRSGAEYRGNAMTNWVGASSDALTLRQFWLADYTQNLVRAQMNLSPSDVVAVQLRADWRDRDYSGMTCGGALDLSLGLGTASDKACLGLTGSQRQSYTVDTQWTPSESFNAFGFYTFGKQDQSQNGNQSTSVTTADAWWTDTASTDHTIGLGGNFVLNERWNFGAQYNWVKGQTKYDQGLNGTATANPLPDDKFTENAVQLFANWNFTADTTLRLNYAYSRVKAANWSYDGFGDGFTSPSICNGANGCYVPGNQLPYTNGLRSPNGADQLVYLSLNVRFK